MRRARPHSRTSRRANSLRRIALVAASTVAAFVLGAAGAEWLFTSSPPPTPRSAPSAVLDPHEGEAETLYGIEPLSSIRFELVPRLEEIRYVDYISPGEMLHDLHFRHGAECDRPDLDRQMIDRLSPRR